MVEVVFLEESTSIVGKESTMIFHKVMGTIAVVTARVEVLVLLKPLHVFPQVDPVHVIQDNNQVIVVDFKIPFN